MTPFAFGKNAANPQLDYIKYKYTTFSKEKQHSGRFCIDFPVIADYTFLIQSKKNAHG
jgi:hypothetical protein